MFGNEEETKMKKYYSLLVGIQQAINYAKYSSIDAVIVRQYNDLLDNIYGVIKDEIILEYKIKNNHIKSYDGSSWCDIDIFHSHFMPIMKYLKDNYINDDVSKIGTLYSTIENEELKKRCLDILSSQDAFDRVINQATQVLETEIKKKAKLEGERLIGLALVSKAIAPKKENTILLFSDEPDIQEAYAFLFKGIIGSYRNPTHHTTDYICTREEALKCCAFIDYLLKELSHSKVLDKTTVND